MAKKLLVADDSLTIQKVIKLALSGDGYEIQTVSDGTECLQQIALFRPEVVLIDIGLPGRSAFDIKKAANEDPDMARIPFVLMSSAFEKVDEAKVALLRFDGRLTKPFDPSNLKSVLTNALKMNSGEGVKEFSPPPPPAGLRSMPPADNDVTGEIQLMDPGLITPMWNEPPSSEPFSLEAKRSEEDTDIRNLTQSTVQMSGLDDLSSWNISEGAKNSMPSIPIPDIFAGTTQVDLEFSPPPPPTSTAAPKFEPTSSSSLPSSASLEAMVEKQVREQLEILVQGAVKSQLEQMARKALPEIAERVVKAEIKKLLEGLAGT